LTATTVFVVRRTSEPSLDAADYSFTHTIRVRFSETDAMGIVHHSRYLPYLEESRVEYLRSIGHPYDRQRDDGVDFAVLEAHVTYRQPLRFDDLVTVHLALSDATRASFSINYLLTVGGQIRSTATTVHACVNPNGRPVRMPTWLSDLVKRA
jgi:acyl-CoA thioester hydrolase